MYSRLLVDLILAGLYLTEINSNAVRNEFEGARNAFGTFVVIALPGLLNFMNVHYVQYPEEIAEEFERMVDEHDLWDLPYWFPEDFVYGEMPCCSRCNCGEEDNQFCKMSRFAFLRLITITQFRGVYELVVSFFVLNRVTAGWRDAVMASVAVHAVPQIFLQCWIFYFQDTDKNANLVGYSVTRYYMQLVSIAINLVGVVFAPNYSTLFEYSLLREEGAYCCCQDDIGKSVHMMEDNGEDEKHAVEHEMPDSPAVGGEVGEDTKHVQGMEMKEMKPEGGKDVKTE